MAELHPSATHHLPSFITPPGETDVLMVVMGIILAVSVLIFGAVFFRLHTLPERMAHRSKKLQFEIVAVLGLLALFTHIHLFWVAGLLLALIDIPDFSGSLSRIAGSTEKLAGFEPGQGAVELPAAKDIHDDHGHDDHGHEHDAPVPKATPTPEPDSKITVVSARN
jgi:hypothetical protein